MAASCCECVITAAKSLPLYLSSLCLATRRAAKYLVGWTAALLLRHVVVTQEGPDTYECN